MTEEKRAVAFVNSMRGKYIIGQALHIAIGELEKVEPPHREQSNIDDMIYLRDNLFPTFSQVEKVSSHLKKG